MAREAQWGVERICEGMWVAREAQYKYRGAGGWSWGGGNILE